MCAQGALSDCSLHGNWAEAWLGVALALLGLAPTLFGVVARAAYAAGLLFEDRAAEPAGGGTEGA